VAAFLGWNDAAGAASTAVALVGRRLRASRFAVIDDEELFDYGSVRPVIDLSRPGASAPIDWPKLELYEARTPGADRDLVLLVGPEPALRWRSFCSAVLTVLDELGVELAVTLGALLADVAHARPVRLTGMASDEELLSGLGTRSPSYQGPTGIVGVLHQAASEHGLAAVSLWAPVPHYTANVVDPKGALALVRGLEAVVGVHVDASELEEAMVEHERRINRAVEADPGLQEMVRRLERAADEEPDIDPSSLFRTGEDLAGELERFLRQRELGLGGGEGDEEGGEPPTG
jgi:proteasome assembly chaperone (PAC2) family protein